MTWPDVWSLIVLTIVDFTLIGDLLLILVGLPYTTALLIEKLMEYFDLTL